MKNEKWKTKDERKPDAKNKIEIRRQEALEFRICNLEYGLRVSTLSTLSTPSTLSRGWRMMDDGSDFLSSSNRHSAESDEYLNIDYLLFTIYYSTLAQVSSINKW